MLQAMRRMARGDWEKLCQEDREANDLAFQERRRGLLSALLTKDAKTKFWIITEWDRSATTVLCPRNTSGAALADPSRRTSPASGALRGAAARTLALTSLLSVGGLCVRQSTSAGNRADAPEPARADMFTPNELTLVGEHSAGGSAKRRCSEGTLDQDSASRPEGGSSRWSSPL